MATKPSAAKQAARKTRARLGNLPVPPSEIRVLWAKAQSEAEKQSSMSDQSAAFWTWLVMESPEWHAHIEPHLDAIDAKRRSDFLYSSRELESVFLFGAFKQAATIRDARNALAGDRKKARELLGFDKPRNPKWRAALMDRLDGVPSEATLSRHLYRFDEDKRLELYRAAGLDARDRHLTYQDFIDELLILFADGSKIETRHVAPHVNKKTGEILNAGKITAPDAGYVSPKSAPADHAGTGWNKVAITTAGRIPVVMPRVVKLQRGEAPTLEEMLVDQLMDEIAPLIGDQIGVLTTDGGFHSPKVSKAAQDAGYVINNHASSHYTKNPKTKESVEKKDKAKYKIQGYPNWYANGHREVFCKCGRRATKKNRKVNGILSVRVEGACPKCGTVSLKAGDRYLTNLGFRLVQDTKNTPTGRRDYALGNGLTYHDPVSEIYGKLRHAQGEGYNSLIRATFGYTKHKRSYRRQIQAETAVAISFFAIHVKTMAQRDHDAAAAAAAAAAPSAAPPPLAA
jgi:hypothetical protein